MDLAKLQGHKVSREVDNLFPTPNTMEHREVKTPEQIAALKAKSPGGYRNLREAVINELFPTPITSDYKNGKSSAGYGLNLPETAKSLMPTPTTRDYKDGSQPHERDGKVQTDTVARAILNSGEVLLGTPRANAANSSSKQVEAGAPKSRIEDQVLTTNWGKFEPAIRRWESIIGRPAPEPTKPDGKDGNHRLSSKFTEWMMGLPDGWITGHDLKRNDELKLAGNGVVPQQAELALRLLLDLPEER
jgi:DNA (cytosine-5)-methyltransferase 1